jgi:hypothetical protein
MLLATAGGADQRSTREQINLDHRYGRIGISAVAAALRYQGARKNSAHASPGADGERKSYGTA